MNDYQDGGARGLFRSLKEVVGTVLATGKDRLKLLSNELEEEKLRTINLLIMALGMVFCFGVFILLAVAFLTVLFWDNSRLIVLGSFTGGFVILGGYFYTQLKHLMQRKGHLFAASIAEFQEDIRQLKAAADHEQQT